MTSTQQFVTQLTALGIAVLAVIGTFATVYINDRRARLVSQSARLDEYLSEQRRAAAELLRLGTKIMSDARLRWDESITESGQALQDLNTLNRLCLELMFLSEALGDSAEKFMASVADLLGYVQNLEDKDNRQQGFDSASPTVSEMEGGFIILRRQCCGRRSRKRSVK